MSLSLQLHNSLPNKLTYIWVFCFLLTGVMGVLTLSCASTQPANSKLVLKTNITDPIEVLFQIGLNETRRGNYPSAIKVFQSLTKETNSPRVRLELARALFLDHRYGDAQAVFNDVLQEPGLPWSVQENVRAYLEAIDDALGYVKFGFSIVSDSNPRNFTDSQQIKIFGQTLNVVEPTDNQDIWGGRYSVKAARDFSGQGTVTGYLNASYTDFEQSQFDRLVADAGLFFKTRALPKAALRIGLEESFYGGDHFYEYPYVGVIYNPDPVYQFRTRSELKVGWLRAPNASLYDATHVSLTTEAARPLSQAVSAYGDLSLEKANAEAKAYSYYGGALGLGLSFNLLDDWSVKPSAAIAVRHYEAVEPVFGETRKDFKKTLSVKVKSERLKAFDYVPELEVRYDRNRSEVSYYSYKKLVVQLNWSR